MLGFELTNYWFVVPPVAFVIVLLAVMLFTASLKAFAIRPKEQAKGFTKPYACGEDSNPMVQPDYRQFFPFAFFFTVLHVVALMVTTLPASSASSSFAAALVIGFTYVLGAIIGLVVLYRK